MAEAALSVLLIGYGNPGRLDDGLGPRLAEAIAAHDLPGVTVESNYQLNVEDAALIAEHDVVIFADAHVACSPPLLFAPLEAALSVSFSTHSIDPASLIALARETFGADVAAFVLGVRGYEFNEFGETLSKGAQENLQRALAFLLPLLTEPHIDRFRAAGRRRRDEAACQPTVT